MERNFKKGFKKLALIASLAATGCNLSYAGLGDKAFALLGAFGIGTFAEGMFRPLAKGLDRLHYYFSTQPPELKGDQKKEAQIAWGNIVNAKTDDERKQAWTKWNNAYRQSMLF